MTELGTWSVWASPLAWTLGTLAASWVILRAKEFVDQYLIKHDFVKRLHTRFNEEGIAIPFPIRTIAYRQPAPDERAQGRAGAA